MKRIDSTLENFNAGWRFVSPDGKKSEITLPHAWNSQGWTYTPVTEFSPAGTGIYTKILRDLPENESLALKFEGASAWTKVFLNNVKIGEHLGAHAPFTVPLENLKYDGHDELRVEVTDKPSVPLLPEKPGTPFTKSPRYKLWALPLGSSMKAGGLWRDVFLVRNASSRVDDLRIESFMDELVVSATLPENTRLSLSMEHAVVRVESEGPLFRAVVRMPHPQLYCFAHPEMYLLSAVLRSGTDGKILQKIERETAFREFTIRDCEFHLNGKPYYLRGQNGFPHCDIPHDREYIRKYVSKIREQGVEISRFHTEPPTHAWLDECDRQGIMVIFETGIHGSMGCYPFDREEFLAVAKREMLDCVREYMCHPSIVMWSLGNEMIVGCERDVGLAHELFKILRDWTESLHQIDPRPVIPSSNGDGVDIERSLAGDVDSVHQYGGWYVETLGDLARYAQIVPKHDTTSQPMIVSESVAAYTNDDGRFFIAGSDVRQKKVVRQRMGRLDATAEEQQDLQAFILKEYAENLWRQRRAGSSFSGYIPFGQYTWFSNPFDKGPDGIRPKKIWTTFRRVLGPCHIQLECAHRRLFPDEKLPATLRIYHENTNLPEQARFTASVRQGNVEIFRKEYLISYHDSICEKVLLPVSVSGGNTLVMNLFHEGKSVGENVLELSFGGKTPFPENADFVLYDPARLAEVPDSKRIHSFDVLAHTVVIGPYAFDRRVKLHAEKLLKHVENGGTLVVLEQNPGTDTEDVFGLKITRKLQPYWSRWAKNLNRYADRADMNDCSHPAFDGFSRDEFERWNGDSYVAHAYLSNGSLRKGDHVLMSVCDGLSDNELMPVEYPDIASDISLIMLERPLGKGKIVFSQALAGSKSKTDPAARKLLYNLLKL